MELDELVVSLGLNPDDFKRGLDSARSAAQTGGQQIADNLIGPLKAALAGLAAGFGFKSMLDTYTQQADAAGKLANSMGVNVEEMQAWGRAAKLSGGSVDGFNGSLRSLNGQIAMISALGKSKALPIFEEMGIKVKDATGKTKDAFQILTDLAGKAETKGKAEFAGLAQRLGIDQGTIMLLQSGRKSVEELVKEMKELGVYQKEDGEIAAAYNDALDKLGWAMQGIGAIIMRMAVPALTYIADSLRTFVNFLRQHEPFVKTFFTIIAVVLAAKAIPAMLQFAKATALAMRPFAPLIAIVTALALIIDDLIVYMEGGESALDDLWSMFGTGPEIAAALSQAWEKLKTTGKELFENLITIAKKFFSYFEGAIQPLKDVFVNLFALIKAIAQGDGQEIIDAILDLLGSLLSLAGNILMGLVQMVADILEAIGSWVGTKISAGIAKLEAALTAFISWLGNVFEEGWETVKQVVASAWEGIKNLCVSAVNAVVNWLQNAWNNIKSSAENAWEGVKNLISNAFNTIVSGIASFASALLSSLQNTWNSVINAATAVWNTLIQTVQNVWDSIVNSISSFGSNLLSGVQNAWNSVLDFFNGLNLFESGQKLLSTFIDGIKAKVGALVDAVKGAFGKVREYLPFSDAHVGPLSQLTVSGSKMLSTFGEGVEQGESGLLDTVGKALNGVKNIFANTLNDKNSQTSPDSTVQPTAAPVIDETSNRSPANVTVNDTIFSDIGKTISTAVTGALDGLSGMADMMKSIMLPQGPQLAMAGISPSITEMDNSQSSSTSITTTVGQVTVNTQATDAQGVANALPGAMRNAFQRAGTNAAISGVRQ